MGKWLVGLAISATVGLLAPGCSSDSDSRGEASVCANYKAALHVCGFTEAAQAPLHCPMNPSQSEVCSANCYLTASCKRLVAMYCERDEALIFDCSMKCLPVSFACGDGQEVTEYSRCDGFAQCFNGADEQGCPTFQCDSGETVAADFQCNQYPNCADGSDEVGCPAPSRGAFQAALAQDCAAMGY